MHIHSVHLTPTLTALRSAQLDLYVHVDQFMDRIEATEPAIQSLIPEPDRRNRLHKAAEALLAQYPDPATRPPLFGAMLGVKDIIHVDGFVTRAGSKVPPELFAGPQATVVTQLQAAGALVVGKTVTTEFAYFEPGPTRNPHNPTHTPGGSSSGSAAAVAAGLCHLSLGTQTIGSVIRPAAFCGVVGFKASFERIATPGTVYFSRTVDHVGLFTQDVAGLKAVAPTVIRDWRSEIGELRRPLLAIPAGPYLAQMERDGMLAFETHVQRLQWGGYTVIRLPEFSNIQALNLSHRRMVAAEFAYEHRELYAEHADKYRPRSKEIIELGKTVAPDEVAAVQANCLALRTHLHQRMDAHSFDLWLTPSATGPAPAGIHATGNPDMNLPWTHAGLPTITLPAGKAENGLPLGVQLSARFGMDEELIGWATDLAIKL